MEPTIKYGIWLTEEELATVVLALDVSPGTSDTEQDVYEYLCDRLDEIKFNA